MRASNANEGEVTTRAGGDLRARFVHFVRQAAVVRMAALTCGLVTLGVLGQCLGTPARANAVATAPPLPSSPTANASVVAQVVTTATPPDVPARVAPVAAGAIADAGVPSAFVPFATGLIADAGSLVDLNTATMDDLRRLPGIGQKRATAILELRAKLGGFRKIEDLMRVRGLGRATIKRLRPLVTLSGTK